MDQPSSGYSENESTEATAADAEAQDERISGMERTIYMAASTGNINNLLSSKAGLSQILTPTTNTALHIYIACAKRRRPNTGSNIISSSAIADILTACPALLFQPNEEGETPLHIAARLGHDDIVTQLISSASERSRSIIRTASKNDKNTALHEAVRFNHFDVVGTLITADREALNCVNNDGET